MMNKIGLFLFSTLLCSSLAQVPAHAQGAAAEMFGVREVVIEYANFDDPKTANACGLSREQIAATLTKALVGTEVPAVAALDAKPPMTGIARIRLIPEVSSYANESLDCVSWVSLSAENHVSVVIPPVSTLRGVTAVYWRQHMRVASGRSSHEQAINEVLQKMAAQFAQQYRLDQPPEFAK